MLVCVWYWYDNFEILSKSDIMISDFSGWLDEEVWTMRVLPKIGGGYFTFISRDGYVFRDGTNGQYIILNKDKNLLITIMASEKEMKNVTEILRDLI